MARRKDMQYGGSHPETRAEHVHTFFQVGTSSGDSDENDRGPLPKKSDELGSQETVVEAIDVPPERANPFAA